MNEKDKNKQTIFKCLTTALESPSSLITTSIICEKNSNVIQTNSSRHSGDDHTAWGRFPAIEMKIRTSG